MKAPRRHAPWVGKATLRTGGIRRNSSLALAPDYDYGAGLEPNELENRWGDEVELLLLAIKRHKKSGRNFFPDDARYAISPRVLGLRRWGFTNLRRAK
jgi:hypothetical protein